jgi:hypothetical protein
MLYRPAPIALLAWIVVSSCNPRHATPIAAATPAPDAKQAIPVNGVVNADQREGVDHFLAWLSRIDESRAEIDAKNLQNLNASLTDFSHPPENGDPNDRATDAYQSYAGDYKKLIADFDAGVQPPACAHLFAAYRTALVDNAAFIQKSSTVIVTEAQIRALPSDQQNTPANQRRLLENADYLSNGIKRDQSALHDKYERAQTEIKTLRSLYTDLRTPEFTLHD